MSTQYKNNHYVPQWYQKRFLPAKQANKEFCYLNLKPEVFLGSRRKLHQRRSVRRLGTSRCFVEVDLYTTKFGTVESTKIEEIFFGQIDKNGRDSVEYFANFTHPSVNEKALDDTVMYMSTQKLRTPKGLEWLSNQSRTTNKNAILNLMLRLRQLYCAVWTECVWLIADASQSDTKFIISDHPVTVYNRACGPRSQWCIGSNDPDIRFGGTHTIFPYL